MKRVLFDSSASVYVTEIKVIDGEFIYDTSKNVDLALHFPEDTEELNNFVFAQLNKEYWLEVSSRNRFYFREA